MDEAERKRRQAGRPGSRARRSKSQRWRDAVAELLDLQEQYRAWLENMPENLQEGEVADRLQEIADLDLGPLLDVDPPRGFGRDT